MIMSSIDSKHCFALMKLFGAKMSRTLFIFLFIKKKSKIERPARGDEKWQRARDERTTDGGERKL